MLNIVIPATGKSEFYKESLFPKLLYEIAGQPIIYHLVTNLCGLKEVDVIRPIFILNSADCAQYHIDLSVRLLCKDECEIIKLRNETKGALCTALIAYDLINNEDPLLIVNADQVIDANLSKIVRYFRQSNFDAAVIGFDSVHPRWSYYHIGEGSLIDEVAEKVPLSHNAIAGFYYFKSGREFIEMAEKAILKGMTTNDRFYISSVLNEFVLLGKNVGAYKIEAADYHSFYCPERADNYASIIGKNVAKKDCK